MAAVNGCVELLTPVSAAELLNPVLRFLLVPLANGCDPTNGFTTLELPQGERVTGIGRNPTNAITIREAHAYVSRDHCRIRSNLADTKEIVLEDLNPNGTYINGKRVGKGRSKRLQCGDEISLAKPKAKRTRIQFKLAKMDRRSKL